MSIVIQRIVRGGAGFLTANLIRKGLGFVFVVAAGSILGVKQFGILALALSIIAVAQNLAVFGLLNTIQRFLSGEGEEDAQALYGTIQIVGLVASVVCCGIFYWAAPWISSTFFSEPLLTAPFRILAFGMLFGVPYTLVRSVLQAQEAVGLIVKADALQTASKVVFFLMLAIFVPSAVAAAWAIVLSLVVSLGLALWYLRRVTIRPVFAPLRRHLGTVLRYSTPLAIVSFGPLVVHQADRLMLGALADASAVGLYALASSLAVVLGTLHNSLVSVFMPIASQAYRNKASDDIEASYLFISKWIGLANGLLLIVFVGLGHEVLSIVGQEFATTESYHVLLMLTAFYFFATWVGPTGALLRMSDGQHVELINTVVFIAANVILNYFLITWLGVFGAALATLCSGILLNVLQVIEIVYRNKFLPVTWKHVEILVIIAVGFCLCLFIDMGPSVRAVLSVLVAGAIGLYAVYTMTDTEKRLVKSFATKMRTRFRLTVL